MLAFLFICVFVHITNVSCYKLPLIQHWNCVGFSNDISQPPYKFNVGEIPLVAWRTQDNNLISTIDGCKHLGSTLHDGYVENDCLVCPYHGIPHGIEDSCGEMIDFDGKLWWRMAGNIKNKLPPKIPYDLEGYSTSYLQVDLDESLPFCAFNAMDVNHPEFVHSGIQGFGSDVSPEHFTTFLYGSRYVERIGISFDYYSKKNIQLFNYDSDIGDITTNYNQYIYPSTTWSCISSAGSKSKMVVGVSMLPIAEQKTRWFVTLRHNYMNNIFGVNLVKMVTKAILNQDNTQFVRQIKNTELKKYMTFQRKIKFDTPIKIMYQMLMSYRYPTVSEFIQTLREENI